MSDLSRAYAIVQDPSSTAGDLHRVVTEFPEVASLAARHPNAYPELAAWAEQFAAANRPTPFAEAAQVAAFGAPAATRKRRIGWRLAGASAAAVVIAVALIVVVPILMTPSRVSAPVTEADVEAIAKAVSPDAQLTVPRGDQLRNAASEVGADPSECDALSELYYLPVSPGGDSMEGATMLGASSVAGSGWVGIRAFPDPDAARNYVDQVSESAAVCGEWVRFNGDYFRTSDPSERMIGEWRVVEMTNDIFWDLESFQSGEPNLPEPHRVAQRDNLVLLIGGDFSAGTDVDIEEYLAIVDEAAGF